MPTQALRERVEKVVDVVDLSRGTKVKCPYTGKVFGVP
jgi:hypothetical protein